MNASGSAAVTGSFILSFGSTSPKFNVGRVMTSLILGVVGGVFITWGVVGGVTPKKMFASFELAVIDSALDLALGLCLLTGVEVLEHDEVESNGVGSISMSVATVVGEGPNILRNKEGGL